MEARKITIVSTVNSQTKKVITSAATTLGELKVDLAEAGVNFTDMDFFEGVSKTKLISDASILPANIPFKGTVTNELVFMLTTTRKKIESGSPRESVYEQVRKHSLQEAIVAYFGKNFTQVTTAELEDFLADYTAEEGTEVEMEEVVDVEAAVKLGNLVAAFEELVEALYADEFIYESTRDEIRLTLAGNKAVVEPSPYDDDVIDEMFSDLV